MTMVARYRTGEIWNKSTRVRSQVVRRVCEILENTYGHSRLGNPIDSIDDLIYIIITNKSSPSKAKEVYDNLRRRFSTWEDLLVSRTTTLYRILKPAGLATVKSRQIKLALAKIKRDFGICDLTLLMGKPVDDVQSYLISLPGVSEKVAKCVMLYTLNMEVLPVDSHVHRISGRLGWTTRKRADQCHQELEELVQPKRRYAFHVGCIMHGRLVCRPENPNCQNCCIKSFCSYNINNVEVQSENG